MNVPPTSTPSRAVLSVVAIAIRSRDMKSQIARAPSLHRDDRTRQVGDLVDIEPSVVGRGAARDEALREPDRHGRARRGDAARAARPRRAARRLADAGAARARRARARRPRRGRRDRARARHAGSAARTSRRSTPRGSGSRGSPPASAPRRSAPPSSSGCGSGSRELERLGREADVDGYLRGALGVPRGVLPGVRPHAPRRRGRAAVLAGRALQPPRALDQRSGFAARSATTAASTRRARPATPSAAQSVIHESMQWAVDLIWDALPSERE